MAARRLAKELASIQKEGQASDVVLEPQGQDLFHWKAVIQGPPDTPFEGGKFTLDIVVPKEYPLHPPDVKFQTKVFHPNIHFKTGVICLDLLKTAWSAIFTLQSVCRSIISLLAHPEPDSPLNCDCGNLLRCGDIQGYNSMAKMYTILYATRTESDVRV